MKTPGRFEGRGARWRTARHLLLFAAIMAVHFLVFESALRFWGSSEAAPGFQGLFEPDPRIGFRLKPHTRTRFATSEFQTDLAINGAGVRDDEEVGPKKEGEYRILILGDSLVFAVQVPHRQTFAERLEDRLNALHDGRRYRVINAGVQGYGPVEEALFFETIAPPMQPDLVLVTLYVGNDAEESYQSAYKLSGPADGGVPPPSPDTVRTALRRLVRRSVVLQILRARVNSALQRLRPRTAAPEAPLQSYAAHPAPRIALGLEIAGRCAQRIGEAATRERARTAAVLMPARFQLDDGDYERLRIAVAQSGGELVRDAATERFRDMLAGLRIPYVDLLPALRNALAGTSDLYFKANAHLTPRGHEVAAEAIASFLLEKGLLGNPSTR